MIKEIIINPTYSQIHYEEDFINLIKECGYEYIIKDMCLSSEDEDEEEDVRLNCESNELFDFEVEYSDELIDEVAELEIDFEESLNEIELEVENINSEYEIEEDNYSQPIKFEVIWELSMKARMDERLLSYIRNKGEVDIKTNNVIYKGKYNKSRRDGYLMVEKVNINNPWVIHEYDGAESVLYVHNIDKSLKYCVLSGRLE